MASSRGDCSFHKKLGCRIYYATTDSSPRGLIGKGSLLHARVTSAVNDYAPEGIAFVVETATVSPLTVLISQSMTAKLRYESQPSVSQ